MTDDLKTLPYSPEQIDKFYAHIEDVLASVDPAKIGDPYEKALETGDRAAAVSCLARHYRQRAAYDIPAFDAGPYDAVVADHGVVGWMREVNIDHVFPDGKIRFLFNPTLEKPPVNHEWLWQLNRHTWWTHMARAYVKTKDERYAEAFAAQFLDWVAETDIPVQWNGVGSAFRTIECGIRLMGSWQTAFNLFRRSARVTDEVLVIMLGSMHKQAQHLLAHPTGGNWLLMETSGIYNFASLYHEFSDAEALRSEAYRRMIDQLALQILPDGMQYELSPDYHVVSFGCAANLYMTALATGQVHELPEAYKQYIYRMAMAAVDLSTPGWIQPRTNDCYTILTDRFTSFAETVFPEDPVFRFVNSRRAEGCPPEGETASRFLPFAGFAAMRSGWDADAACLCFDVGPLGMGHMHQDKLNINLFKGDEELIFDDGGGQYEVSSARVYGLSAYDHNTVTVDGLGQSRRDPKRVTEPIDAGWITNDTFDYAYGIYDDTFGDGLRPAMHRREVRFCKPSVYVVRDTLTSSDGAAHIYGLRFHLDTLETTALPGGGILATYGKTWDLAVIPLSCGEGEAGFRAVSGQTEPCLLGWYIGRNESKNHPATTILMDSAPSLDHTFTTLLIPMRHGEALPDVHRESDGTVVISLDDHIWQVHEDGLHT